MTLELVLAETGAPLAGVGVRALGEGPLPEERLTADEAGRVEIHLDAPARLSALFISASRHGFLAWVHRDLELLPGEGRELRLELNKGPSLGGVVRDEREDPVPFADVHLWVGSEARGAPHGSYRAGPDGRFRLPPQYGPFLVSASAPERTPIEALAGEPRSGGEVDLHVAPSRALVARVATGGGAPVAGARVEVQPPLPSPRYLPEGMRLLRLGGGSALTGPGGEARFEGVAGVPLQARVDAAGFETWRGLAPRGADLDVTLREARSFTGHVLSFDGSPAVGAEVTLRAREVLARATCDAQGRFRLEGGAARAKPWIGVVAEGCAVHVVEPLPQPGVALEIRLEPARALAGRLLFADGSPAADHPVRIAGERTVAGDTPRRLHEAPTWEHLLAEDEARTDEAGRFRFERLYDGAFEVSAPLPDDRERRQRWLARSGDEELELRFDPEAAGDVVLEGAVRDALSGLPVERFEVIVLGYHPGGSTYNSERLPFSSPEGRFRIAGLRPGQLGLVVEAPGYANGSVAMEELAAGTHDRSLELTPSRTLRLRLLDEAGAPLAGGTLLLTWRDRNLWLRTPDGGHVQTLTADEAGEIVLRGVPGDLLKASLHFFGDEQARTFELDLRSPPPEGVLELRLPPGQPPK